MPREWLSSSKEKTPADGMVKLAIKNMPARADGFDLETFFKAKKMIGDMSGW